MSGRVGRPSAFEVSFPGDVEVQVTSKRKLDEYTPDNARARKQRQLPPVAYYKSHDNEIYETDDLIVPGETDDLEGQVQDGSKPIRVLNHFVFFDSSHRNELLSLTTLDEEVDEERHLECAGQASASFANDEDEGEEDDLIDGNEALYVRIGKILRYYLNVTSVNEPVYIESQYAWYILKSPSSAYTPYYQHFYTRRRIAQIVVATAISRPQQSFESFLTQFTSIVDMFGMTYLEKDLWDSLAEIRDAVEDCRSTHPLGSVLLIRHLLRRAGESPSSSRRRSNGTRPLRLPSQVSFEGVSNVDLAVLRPENQNPTHVTHFVAKLVQGLVQEDLVVIGPPPARPDRKVLDRQKRQLRATLWGYLKRARRTKKYVDHHRQDRLTSRSDYLTAVTIDDVVFKIGDFVIVLDEQAPEIPESLDDLPFTARIDEYFRFAQIRYLRMEDQVAHVRWLEHARQIFLQELANPQELFFINHCQNITFNTIVANVKVSEAPTHPISYDEFFYKFVYRKAFSTFESINTKNIERTVDRAPPDNCPNCMSDGQRDQDLCEVPLFGENGARVGVAHRGKKFHVHDTVMYRAECGPAQIGFITKIKYPVRDTSREPTEVTVKRLGRISDIEHHLPPTMLKDERHLYLTDEVDTVVMHDLLKVIYAYTLDTLQSLGLEQWLSLSPDHFYIKYKFPVLSAHSWDDRRRPVHEDLPVCAHCCEERLKYCDEMHEFANNREKLAMLDIFSGCGAFSRGLSEGSQCLKVTHAVEISPSAAQTFMHNAPDAQVFNQCSNVMLRYALKYREGHAPVVPKQLFDGERTVPEPPQPGEIQVICAGFPCQSHSALNMFKRAEDYKSNLIFNAISWVDFLRPRFCFFENVPGFLRFNLNSTQATQYRVEGGIPMGGLKFLVRAMLDMGYQIRYGLLQAVHYGAPQRRVRFFLVAALTGHPLPELPLPTHDFPETQGLTVKLPGGQAVNPIRTGHGTANHPFVSVDAAISDLPRFDWKVTLKRRESASNRRQDAERARVVPAVDCRLDKAYCGLDGVAKYHHPPTTRYQLEARADAPRRNQRRNLQHFTKCLLPEKVDRVVSIPLDPNADYRSLRTDQYEWQFANPSSSVGRLNYRPGLYGRLDHQSVFPTIVTNVDPTAKQSRVLNPYCKRMVTVRELARAQGFPDSFMFKAIGDSVVTMHRQIGNAVPLPMGIALGRELGKVLFEQWKEGVQREAAESGTERRVAGEVVNECMG